VVLEKTLPMEVVQILQYSEILKELHGLQIESYYFYLEFLHLNVTLNFSSYFSLVVVLGNYPARFLDALRASCSILFGCPSG
jgi:hypothetical protein